MKTLKVINKTNTLGASQLEVEMPQRFSVDMAESFINWAKTMTDLEKKPDGICLNFANTNFIDSSGIGSLVGFNKIIKQLKMPLFIINVNEQLQGLFRLTRLDELLNLTEVNSQNKPIVNNEELDLQIEPTHQSIRSYTKRIMDICGSIVGLGITGVLLAPIAIAIKLESKGPILFSQTRVGLMGRQFKIYKFRTMVNDAEAKKSQIKNESEGAIFKCKNDPRITRVGQFLRKTSLDELPQFFNVLMGSMSLIGTRPPTVDELEKYNIPHWQRLDVKPGISGEWQVNGRSAVKNFEDIVALDLRYQKNWSLMYDFLLIFKTIKVIFSKNNGAM